MQSIINYSCCYCYLFYYLRPQNSLYLIGTFALLKTGSLPSHSLKYLVFQSAMIKGNFRKMQGIIRPCNRQEDYSESCKTSRGKALFGQLITEICCEHLCPPFLRPGFIVCMKTFSLFDTQRGNHFTPVWYGPPNKLCVTKQKQSPATTTTTTKGGGEKLHYNI